jgi:hypothetical protein
MTSVIITGWEVGLKKVSLSKRLQEEGRLSLARAKHSVDEVLEGRQVELTFLTSAAATRFVAAARQLHAVCILVDAESP